MTNKEKYKIFCEKEKSISVFSQGWWLDIVCGSDNWDILLVEKGGSIFASMPFYIVEKMSFKNITHPILTQTMGIYFKYPKNQKYYKKLSFEKEMITKLLIQLPNFDQFSQSFHHQHTNLLPFYWLGYSINSYYTYVIEKITLEALEKGFESDIRRRIKKASELGIHVYESDDIESFYELNKMSYERHNREIFYSFEFFKNLYTESIKNNSGKLFVAKDKEGNIIAGSFLVYDKSTVYYLMGGVESSKKDLGAMDVLLSENIKFALANNKKFDFEGSMVESIEKYFRSFGAIQKPYFNVSKTNSLLLNLYTTVKNILK